jgi:hypothetical protein
LSTLTGRLRLSHIRDLDTIIVPADGTVCMVASGNAEVRVGNAIERVGFEMARASVTHVPTWSRSGGGSHDGIVLKRMTTIAQKQMQGALPAGVTPEDNESYFGHADGARDTPLVHWRNVHIGKVGADGSLPTNPVLWRRAQTYALSTDPGVYNYPNASVIIDDCLRTSIGAGACADEVIAVDLSPPQKK